VSLGESRRFITPVDKQAIIVNEESQTPTRGEAVLLVIKRRRSSGHNDLPRPCKVLDVFAGCALGDALGKHPGIDAARVLADLLVNGRCTRFSLANAAVPRP